MLTMRHYHQNPDSLRSSISTNISSCIPRTSIHYVYRGERDQYGLREKEAYIEKKTHNSLEIYEGNFVNDNQHGNAVYRWISDKGKTVYEGYIYCNKLHGYGRFSYPDGSVFEGLYKDNRRFGPGVLTEPDGKENVGIWRNKKLIKLAVKVETGVPILSSTHYGKAKVDRFKDIVPINKTFKDITKEILIEMKAPLYILELSENLYNILIKDNRSEAFHWSPYEEIYRRVNPEKQQDLVQTGLKTETKFKAGRFKKKGRVANKWKELIWKLRRKKAVNKFLVLNATHLVAWNNSSVMKDVLLFSFKHIDQEEIVSFDVTDILKSNRDRFRAAGTHETLILRFLKKCEIGDFARVHDYLAFKNIDPNVADYEGNTGLITAAANDQLAVIDEVLDRGADINMCNDEGFTPLALCVTRYLALKNDVKDWEKTFLHNSGEINYPENTLKWRHQGKEAEEYFKSSECDEKLTIDDPKSGTKEKSDGLSEETLIKLAVIKETILKLIERGADPKVCDVPMPLFNMAVSCGDVDIVTCLLEARVNQTTTPQDIRFLNEALFVAVQLPQDDKMVALCTTLLKYGADPNAKIQGTPEDELTFKICELSENEKGMKTVLHALASRHDGIIYDEYLCAVVKLLLNNNANPNALFLGHTPLSAAIVRGNAGMVKCLMTSAQVDPNQKLAKKLGVPLTVLVSQECARKLPTEIAMCMVDFLVNSGAQLLHDLQVESFTGNVIEFAHAELDDFKRQNKKEKSKKSNILGYQTVVDYVTKVAQQGLINKIKEILWRSSQPFASYGIKVSRISGFSRKADRERSKNALRSTLGKERMYRDTSKDALPTKWKEETKRDSSKDVLPTTKRKEEDDRDSSKDVLSNTKTKEKTDRISSKDILSITKRKEKVGRDSSKDVLPTTKRKRIATRQTVIEGLPSWLNAKDIVQIINLIQERERTRVTREQASFALGMVMPRESEADQEKMDKFLSFLEGPENMQESKKKKSERKDKITEKKSAKISRRKSKDRKSWNLLTALKRARSGTETKAIGSQNIKNYESDKVKNSDVCFVCGGNFTNDLLRLCPVCKQVKFCSADCFWKSRKNNTHMCIGDIFPDWKNESEHSDSDKNEGGDVKKINKKQTKRELRTENQSPTTDDEKQADKGKKKSEQLTDHERNH